MPSSGLAGVARREGTQLTVDGEARAQFHFAVGVHARVEAVERAHRRAADRAPEQVIHATVAGTDEALGRIDPAHRTPKVRAAVGDRDELGAVVVWVGVDRRVELAHVHRRLAGLADLRVEREDDRYVVELIEHVGRPHAFPAHRRAFEDRSDRERQRRQQKGRRGNRARGVGAARHEAPARDGLTIEGSGDRAIERVDRGRLGVLVGHRHEQYRGAIQCGAKTPCALVRIASIASGAPSKTSCLARRWFALEPQPTARAPAPHTACASSG